MFKNIIGGKIFCGLDIGSQKLKASVVRVRNIKSIELLGVQEILTKGFSRSAVSDVGELARCIQQTISALSQQVGIKLKDIQLGIGGEWIESRLSHALIPLLDKGNKVVSVADIKRVNHQARLLGMKMDEKVIHDFAQSYSLDDQTTHLTPIGLYARTMAVNMLLIIVNTIRLSNLMKAVHEAGLEVSNIFFTSYAAAESSVDHQAKTDGCALIDIGASSTSTLIFKDGFLRSVMNIPWGGDHATQSIAQNLHLSFDLAEEIKKSYGMVLNQQDTAGGGSSSELETIADERVLVKHETGYLPIKREVICRLLEPEITQLVDALAKSVKGPFYPPSYRRMPPQEMSADNPAASQAGYTEGPIPSQLDGVGLHSQLKAGVIIVGGGSLLSGLLEHIEKGTNLPVHLGKIKFAGAQLNNAAIFSSSIGLASLGFTKTFAYSLAASPHLPWKQDIVSRIKELYQEYF